MITILWWTRYFFLAVRGWVSYRYFQYHNTLTRLIAFSSFTKEWVIDVVKAIDFSDAKQTPSSFEQNTAISQHDEATMQTLASWLGESFETTQSASSSPQPTTHSPLVAELLAAAELLKNKGQFLLYEKKLIEGTVLEPSNTTILKKLAQYYFHNNNHKKSISLLKKVIDIDPTDHEALWQLGDIYIEQWEFDQAELLVRKAIDYAHDRPKYYISLAEITYNTDRITEALNTLHKAVHLRPNNVNYLIALAWLYEEIEDYVNAKKYYFHVLECEPTNTQARRKLNTL